ncbi:hypothetical protein [Winogradskyella luteola]|uniref:Uncharacterized protein n=1 Tax=Winogradskyella luteola TaxID=2828330 RepID=A0A9X1F541_9FLAO|nr:hypothetical protein [Winogradskyella luteola]MBV7267571.1 hypothetical protein [Winogradskyella luteola]
MKNQILILCITLLTFSCSNDDNSNESPNLTNNVNVEVNSDSGQSISFSMNTALLDKHCSDIISYFFLNVNATSENGDIFDFRLNIDFYDQEIEGFDTSFPQTYSFDGSYNNDYFDSTFLWNGETYTIVSTNYTIENFVVDDSDQNKGLTYGTYTMVVESVNSDMANINITFNPVITDLVGGC